MELNRVLKSTKIFYDLGEEELTEIGYSITEKQYANNAVILQEGSTTQSLYIIKEGQVSIEIPMGNDFLQLAVLEAGDFFGEMGLILSHPHSATVRALQDSSILQMNRHDLDVILNWNTLLGAKLWRAFSEVLAQRVLDTNNKLKGFFQGCQTHLTESDSDNLKDISKGIFK